jgi:hypothetical protein
MTNKDILLDEDDNFVIQDGDLVIAETDMQHIRHIIETHPGEIRRFPTVGVGLSKHLKGSADGRVRRKVFEQLKADGYDIENVITNDNDIKIVMK